MRFLGLELKDKVPDAKTIWLFKERLIEGKVSRKLFERFGKEPAQQHNSKEENEQIKQGEIPQARQGEKHKAKLCQKDRDARWTKKHNRSYFGYKDHVKSKFILKATVTAAHVHDSQELEHLVEKKDKRLHADTAKLIFSYIR